MFVLILNAGEEAPSQVYWPTMVGVLWQTPPQTYKERNKLEAVLCHPLLYDNRELVLYCGGKLQLCFI